MNPDAEALSPATVVGAYGRRMKIRLQDEQLVDARIKGKRLQPVCGDRVLATPIAGESDWLISDILDRDNELTRPDRRGHREVIAANLQCVAVMAAVEPEPDWFVVDRYLAAAENMSAEAMVIYNKVDLGDPTGSRKTALESYQAIGYPTVLCSANSGTGLGDIAEVFKDKTSIIVGQSGVGKSSIVNALTESGDQQTAEISGSTGEGRHTTVNAVTLRLPSGGDLIDSPGVRDYAPMIESATEAIRGFREVSDAGKHCRFADCQHLREPNCAVKSAVEDSQISERRMESYRRLLAHARGLSDRKYRN